MLLIAAIVFAVGLVLELFNRANIGVPVQVVGAVLLFILSFGSLPLAIAFGAFVAVRAIQILR